MHWLLHGSVTSAAAEALVRHGHKAHLPAEGEISEQSPPGDVLKSAKARQWDLITTDPAVSNAPFETEDRFPRSIVFLQLPGGDVEQDDAIDRLFARYKRLTPGRLYTVTENRVKIRQLPKHL
jgi:hypothetical protein